MTKRIIVIGFMLFALFFGAGNLIFPPSLGWSSGSYFYPAIIGFVVTGVGLPLIGVIAGSFSDGGFNAEAARVHRIFAVLFMLAIYLTIGPFFAIPRTATVSYEMGVVPFIGGSKINLLVFTGIYFIVVFILSVKPSKMVDLIGKFLTPLLLICIAALAVKAFFALGDPVVQTGAAFDAKAPFFDGFLNGYQTMDTIAAVAFATIVINAVRISGVIDNRKDLLRYSAGAAVIAGICLALVYLSLGWVGNHFHITPESLAHIEAQEINLGTYILTQVAQLTYGVGGKSLMSAIVILACLTTSIGLVVAISSYFYELWPRHSYKTYAVIFTLISFGLANQGLNQVIKGSIPVLLIIYPITIVLIALIFINQFCIKMGQKELSNLCYQLPIYVTLLVSMLSVFAAEQMEFLPLSNIGMVWLLPAIASFVLALLIRPTQSIRENQ